jgi:hypothetical protein
LNDLVERVDKSLERLEQGQRDLCAEMRDLRAALRTEMRELRDELRNEISALRRDGTVTTVAIVAAIVGTGLLT